MVITLGVLLAGNLAAPAVAQTAEAHQTFVGATIMRAIAPRIVHARSEVINKPGAIDIFTGTGVYDDQIVKSEQGWRFKSRLAGPNGTIPVHADFLD